MGSKVVTDTSYKALKTVEDGDSGLHLAQGRHLARRGVEVEVEDAGWVPRQLERAGQLLELAAAAELHFPHLGKDKTHEYRGHGHISGNFHKPLEELIMRCLNL